MYLLQFIYIYMLLYIYIYMCKSLEYECKFWQEIKFPFVRTYIQLVHLFSLDIEKVIQDAHPRFLYLQKLRKIRCVR